jgi:hypothetical protein
MTATLLMVGLAAAQPPGGSYRPVDLLPHPLDRSTTWTLHFAYTPPRILTLDVPGRGRRVVWYMAYQVWNTTDTPLLFIPRFDLVTKDGPLVSLPDDPQPSVTEAVRKVEDPTNSLNMKTSVSMTQTPIPVTKADSIPRSVYGIAVWSDAAERAPTVNNFSVYVTGLSNGISESPEGAASRKTLQLDFVRPTDTARQSLGDIRPNDNGGLGASKWIYRQARVADVQPAGM